jgi:hypothetical protein
MEAVQTIRGFSSELKLPRSSQTLNTEHPNHTGAEVGQDPDRGVRCQKILTTPAFFSRQQLRTGKAFCRPLLIFRESPYAHTDIPG